MDAIERAIWNDVEMHKSGCWTWKGFAGCNIIRLLAELSGKPLPIGMKLYRMSECAMGKDCVNPDHVGTGRQWRRRVQSGEGDEEVDG
jgi:hypothetical protein